MSTLRGFYVSSVTADLGDKTHGRDVGPLYRHSQRFIGASPAPFTGKDIPFTLVSKETVEAAYLISDSTIVGHREGSLLEVYDIVYIGNDSIAQ